MTPTSRNQQGTTTARTVYDALERCGCDPRGPEHHFRSRCPAHDSNSPSLVVRLSDSGNALLACMVGCDLGAIVDALGLTWAHLFPPRGPDDPRPVRVTVQQRMDARFEAISSGADNLLCALRTRFGETAHRATENPHCWTATCPVCRGDQLVIVEDEHDPLDRQGERPAVRATCFGCGTTTDEIYVELGMVA